MPAVDRGEGHPVNRRTLADIPAPTTPAPRPAGLFRLAQVLGQARLRLDPPGRLILEHGPGLLDTMGVWSGRPEITPHPRLAPGSGVSYRMVEGQARDDLGPGGWRLIDQASGEIETGRVEVAGG